MTCRVAVFDDVDEGPTMMEGMAVGRGQGRAKGGECKTVEDESESSICGRDT